MNFRAARGPAGMSRHNQLRSVEEDFSLLGGAHAIKSVKPSTDILEGLSTGVQVYVSAPHLMHKWLHKSLSPSFMLLKSGSFFFFCAPRPCVPQTPWGPFFYFSCPFVLRAPAALEILRKSYGPFSFCVTL